MARPPATGALHDTRAMAGGRRLIMGEPSVYAALDLGASSARLFAGRLERGRLALEEVARSPNRPVRLPDGLHSDVVGLHQAMLEGLAETARRSGDGPVWVGIDSWGVDYGLLDDDGHLLGLPYHYRDNRTEGMGQRSLGILGPGRLYELTGIQQMELNTVFQLMADSGTKAYQQASTLLMLPDLLGYFLTGQRRLELTNASTTQLLDARTGHLVDELFDRLGLRRDLFAPMVGPGALLGPVLPEVASSVGLSVPVQVVNVASHDTASAVLAVPAAVADFAYVISGTWSLVGLELDRPVVNEASREANFSNELGADGTVRFLRNCMGHWMVQECQREWGRGAQLGPLLAQARTCAPFRSLVATAAPAFARPGNMTAKVRAACAENGQPVPETEAEVVRCIVDSMAVDIAAALGDAQHLAGRDIDAVHLVGGGVSNELLTDLLAALTGHDVVTGPVEASAVGNLLMQLRASGLVEDRHHARRLVASSLPVRTVHPDPALARAAASARDRLARR